MARPLRVAVLMDERDLKRGVKESTSTLQGFGSVSAAIGERFRAGFGAAIKTGAAIAAGGLTAVIAVVPRLVSAGAALESMGRKSATVFGDQLPVVAKWAEEAAAGMGLTARQATGLAAGFADLLVPMGFTRQQAAGMATDVIGLSGALAEWSGGQRGATEVADILSAAMLGERDALQGLGISISQAEVDARVLENAQKGVTFATEEQAQAFATQEIIFEKSRDAQAAYASSTDDLASKQARLRAVWESVKETALNALVPALGAALDAATRFGAGAANLGTDLIAGIQTGLTTGDWSGVTSSLKTGLSDAIAAITGVGTDLTTRFSAWVDEIDWGQTGENIGTGLAKALNSLVSAADQITAAIAAWFRSVKWGDIALEIGAQVPTIALGLVTGLANFDWGSLFQFVADNWRTVLLAVLAVALAPAKVAAGLAKVLRHIPFVGEFSAAVVLWLNQIGGKFTGWVGQLLSTFGRALVERAGLIVPSVGALFGRITGAIGEFFGTLGTTIYVWLDDAFKGLAGRLGTLAGAVVEPIVGFFRTAFDNAVISAKLALDSIFTPLGEWGARVLSIFTTAWDNVIAFFAGTGTRIVNQFYIWREVISGAWREWLDFLGFLFRGAWDGIISFFAAVGQRAIAALSSITAPFRTAWDAFLNGLRTIWDNAWGAIESFLRGAGGRLLDIVRGALNGVRDFIVSVLDNVIGFFDNFAERAVNVFVRLVDGIGNAWDRVKSVFRAPLSAVVSGLNAFIRGINVVARLVRLPEIPQLSVPELHSGGVVGEQGVKQRDLLRQPPKRDEVLALLRKGETVVPANGQLLASPQRSDAYRPIGDGEGILGRVKGLAADAFDALRRAVADLARPAIEAVKRLVANFGDQFAYPGQLVAAPVVITADGALTWLADVDRALESVAPKLGAGIGWQAMWSALRAAVPDAQKFSDFRPGAVTRSGNTSWHARGRAIDVSPWMRIFDWVYKNYFSQTRELIFSPAGGRQIRNGAHHLYTGGVRADHFDHVHWAMDNGGILPPGMSLVTNRLGRPEPLGRTDVLGPKLDRVIEQNAELITLYRRAGTGANITVNDVSGDPTETARAVKLALRLGIPTGRA